MAASTLNLVYDNSSDNNFKAWAKAISDQLLTFGWTKTGDTGQIDWNGVTRPTAAGTAQGYEIWQMGDGLQATAPLFLKIEYGGGGSPLYPSLWLTLGTATSGAGVLSGTVTTRTQIQANGNTTVAQVMKFSGASNRFLCALAPEFNAAQNTLIFGVERTHNDDGSDNDVAGLLFYVGSGTKGQLVCPKAGSGAAPVVEIGLGCITPLSASSVRGTDFGLYPVFVFLGRMLNPLKNALVYFNNEITANVAISAMHYGGATTLYTVGGAVGNFSRGAGTDASNSRLALRFE